MLHHLDNYSFVKEIGKGAFGVVFEAKHKISGKSVAVKVITKFNPKDPFHLSRARKELSIMRSIHHIFACELLEVLENEDFIYIIMEFVEGENFRDYVNQRGKIPELQAKKFFTEIALVMKHLHCDIMVAHRDLKAENILIDKEGRIRIIDFGLSKALDAVDEILKTACGSIAYAPPEMVRGESYTLGADIWSLGILLYAMVAGRLPYEDENMGTLIKKIMYLTPNYPELFTKDLKDLLNGILMKDPKQRFDINKILSHPWLDPNRLTLSENLLKPIGFDEDILETCESMGLSSYQIKQNIESQDLVTYRILLKGKNLSIINREIHTKENERRNSFSFSLPARQSMLPVPNQMGIETSSKRKNSSFLDSLRVPIRRKSVNSNNLHTFKDPL